MTEFDCGADAGIYIPLIMQQIDQNGGINLKGLLCLLVMFASCLTAHHLVLNKQGLRLVMVVVIGVTKTLHTPSKKMEGEEREREGETTFHIPCCWAPSTCPPGKVPTGAQHTTHKTHSHITPFCAR